MLFEALDKKDSEKAGYPSYVQKFPYVNGKLFTDKVTVPELDSKVRKLILECGGRDWKEINPDIFGSMFQAVSVAEVRSGLGQHYTSVPNIMKVIEPLFLNDLREEFEKAETEKKLRKLLDRIYNLKIFDPACGSGNFLIIAYKQLRLLEMEIIKKIHTLPGQHPFMMSRIQLNQFYGIEIDDFACEIARLSLWLAEHQMNRKFKDEFGDCKPPLPLSMSGNIVCGNATRLDWEKVCPKGIKGFTHKEMEQMTFLELEKYKQLELQGTDYEIYILGNPPYEGARKQSSFQKNDMTFVFDGVINNYKNLDYISCWFKKASEYIIRSNAKLALVSTNSIVQGEQVPILWKYLLGLPIEIYFAYRSFKWGNNAKNKAQVTCVIIGMRNKQNGIKYLFENNIKIEANNINGYLIDSSNIFVEKRNEPLSNNIPVIRFGSMPNDNGNLILSAEEKDNLIEKYPHSIVYIKKMIGSDEFIKGYCRFCLWITDENKEEALKIPFIKEKVENVANYRKSSKRVATQKLAIYPYKFAEIRYQNATAILIPEVSSENYVYIPMGFISNNTVINNRAFTIYNPELWLLGCLLSRMHKIWINTVAGRLETRINYSSTICYNNFPFPNITDKQKKIIEMHVNNILAEREKHSDRTMAELYNLDKMPQGLRDAHHGLDLAIEKCYRQAPFESDEKRLEHLFKRYEIMTDPTKQANVEEQLSLL